MTAHFKIAAADMPQPVGFRTLDQLRTSPFNVRRHQPDATATSDLEASIPVNGLLLPLRIHPLATDAGMFGVHAGGRRLLAITRLVANGTLPSDWPVPVFVSEGRTDAQLIEESIAENRDRKDLRPYEIYAGVAEVARLGETVASIARAVNEDPTWVRQAIRLGTLAQPVFNAFAAEVITIDQARAYAATEDHAAQLAAFNQLSCLAPYEHQPRHIREALKVNDPELGRLLAYVGEAAYRGAGGRWELDLFAGDAEARGRVVDEGVLRTLVQEKLEGERQAIRTSAGRDVRFIAEKPRNEFRLTDYQLQVTPKDGPDGAIELPDGDIVAHIEILAVGKLDVTWWWESRAAKFGTGAARAADAKATPAAAARKLAPAAAIGHAYDSARKDADAAVRHDTGLSADQTYATALVRRAILRGELLDDARHHGTVGLDYLVWSQLRHALHDPYSYPRLPVSCGARAIAADSRESDAMRGAAVAEPLIQQSAAGSSWKSAVEELSRESFATERDGAAAFRAYRSAEPAVKGLAAAFVAGFSLERSLNAPGYVTPAHDALATELDLDDAAVREHWAPSADFLNWISIDQRLRELKPLVEGKAFNAVSKRKSAQITTFMLEVVTGAAHSVRRTMRERARTWVHPLLSFGVKRSAPAEQPEMAEAAQ